LINKISFKDRVIFTGFVSNVEDYIYSSDVILCCSKHEGIPRTVVESVVLGKPVVSTTAAKIEEIFDEHLLKLVKFVRIPDVDNFVFFVEEVIKNIESYKKLQLKFDIKKFSYERMVSEYLDFYKL